MTTLNLANCSSVNCLRSLPIGELAYLNQAVQNASYPSGGDGFGVYYWVHNAYMNFLRSDMC